MSPETASCPATQQRREEGCRVPPHQRARLCLSSGNTGPLPSKAVSTTDHWRSVKAKQSAHARALTHTVHTRAHTHAHARTHSHKHTNPSYARACVRTRACVHPCTRARAPPAHSTAQYRKARCPFAQNLPEILICLLVEHALGVDNMAISFGIYNLTKVPTKFMQFRRCVILGKGNLIWPVVTHPDRCPRRPDRCPGSAVGTRGRL